MKAGWETRQLIDLCDEFRDGNWIESKDQSQDGIRLVQTGNVGNGRFKNRAHKARYIDEETFGRLNCFEVLPGDCLISRLPDPVGRACEIPDTGKKMITAVDCSIVRVNNAKILRDYFIYFSQSKDYLKTIDDLCSGTTRKRISRKNLGKVGIPLPSLEEQKRIVAVLDAAFEGLDRARAHCEANLQNARDLFESGLVDAFANLKDAPLQPLSKCGEIISGNNFSSKDFSPSNEIHSIKITNVGIKKFVETHNAKLPSSFVESFCKYSVPAGSIVIALTRTIISDGLKIAIVPDQFEGALLNQRVAAIKFMNSDNIRDYIYLYLCT